MVSDTFDIDYNDNEDEKVKEDSLFNQRDDLIKYISSNNTIEYDGTNVVEWYRLPLTYPTVDSIFYATKCREFVCPITHQRNVQRLEIKKIYKSNAKPLLVNCYLHSEYEPVSSFILKYGDDLRRDAAVLMMFKFMNSLWNESRQIYNGKNIEALTYKCIPLGPDYGIIELIPNCQTLKELTDKYKSKKYKLSENVMNNLIATCAGSFMAAYIMGIRDRHYDNVLVTGLRCHDFKCFCQVKKL